MIHVGQTSQIEQNVSHSSGDSDAIKIDPVFTQWTESFLEIQLNFEEPLEISRIRDGYTADFLRLLVVNPAHFESEESGLELKPENFENGFLKILPKQLPNDVSEEKITEAASNS